MVHIPYWVHGRVWYIAPILMVHLVLTASRSAAKDASFIYLKPFDDEGFGKLTTVSRQVEGREPTTEGCKGFGSSSSETKTGFV